jgi:predicted O-methyltransferase YrrM
MEVSSVPKAYLSLLAETKQAGFTMGSDSQTGSLLRTLASSKPGGRVLELGTGTGLSTAWILDGMDETASLTSVDHDENLIAIAESQLGRDKRLQLVCRDGADWINANRDQAYDYVFADTWHGKYLMLDEVLAMIRKGGFYLVDDMLPQPNWPEGHAEKASTFARQLQSRVDLVSTRIDWTTGIIITVKK